MAYLVRKIIKRNKLDLLKEDVYRISADVPSQEMRTMNSALSTWEINDIDSLEEAVLAIAITSSKITKMDFILIDTELLDQNDLSYQRTYAGTEIAVPDLQNTHCDIQNINISNLIKCVELYKKIYTEDNGVGKYIRRYSIGEIKAIIKEAYIDNRLDLEKLNSEMKTSVKEILNIA